MTFTYQWPLVAFSVFIAIFAAYTTLRVAFRLAWASQATRLYWIAGGACSMGIGIWTMHFMGMLALHLPIPVAYDPLVTALSLLPAIFASAIALAMLGQQQARAASRFVASVLMGLGIVAMHYSGMAAMKMAPPIVYDRTLLVLSLLIAVGASWVALYLFSRERREASPSLGRRLVSAVLMGLAIAGMHYTSMAAAEFAPEAICTVAATGWGGDTIGVFVGLVAVLVLAASLALTFYDEVLGENNFYKALLAAQSNAGEGVLLIEGDRVIYANQAMESLSGYTAVELSALPSWTALLEDAGAALLPSGAVSDLSPEPGAGRQEVMLRVRGGQRLACEAVLSSFRHGDVRRQLLVCIDISGRKAAQEALQARDAQARELALVAARTDNAVIITDAQGLILWVNEGFERISGFSLDEAMGKNPGRLLQGPDTDPVVRRMMREQLARGEGFETEIVNYDKAGRKYWVALNVKPVHDEAGGLVKFIAIERDVTERKQADAALRLSEVRLKEAQQLARVGSWELDLARNEYIMSDESLRIHELDPSCQRVSRETVVALMHPDDQLMHRQSRAQALASLGSYALQIRLRFADGRIKHVQLRAAVQADAQGNPLRVIGTIQDITEQTLAEQALREREAQARELALVASGTDNGVIIMDADTRITWVNEGFTRMSGYTLAEVRGKSPGDVLNGPETDVGTYAFIQECISKGERFEAEIIHYHKSGRRYWAIIDVQAVYDERGQLVKYISIERDITQNKQAEEALRRSEALLQEAQRLAHIGSWELDLVTNEYRLSKEALRIHELDVPDGRVSREAMAATLPPEDGVELRRARLDAMHPGGTYSARVRLVFADGRTKYVQVRGVVHCDEQDQPVRVLGTVQDLTEYALAELALRDSELRLKEAQRLAKIGHWEFNFAQDDYLMSEETLRIHELESADGRVSRVRVAEMLHPEDRDTLRERRTAAMANCSDFEVVLRLLLPGDRMKYVHLRGAVQGDDRGRPARVNGTLQDITEQKQAELALRELNETLEQRVLERTNELEQQRAFIETILNTAETLIFVIDTRGCFVRFNEACERLTGYRFEELRDRPIWESVIPPERRAAVRAKYENQTSPAALPRNLEVEWLTRDGQRRLVSWSNAMLTDEAGRLQYMIGTGIDITERKRAELALIEANDNLSRTIGTLREAQSQLVQSEKMASLGALVAGISHEINTPIGIGVTSATTLQEEFKLLSRAFAEGTLKRSALERFITHGINGCDILVNNLLRAAELIRSFKQVAVDQSSNEWRHLNLHDYIDEIVLSLKPRFKGTGVEVVNDSDRQLVICTHPGAIYQILSNLLLNALIHAYEAGQPGRIRMTAEQVGDEIQLEFSDDGKGIAADIEGRIFDPFFTTRRGAGGSGLGLHIVYNLVAGTLGGVIHLVKKDGGTGTAFRIRFPLQPGKEGE